MSKYRILSLDGGGVRGVLTARLLERLAAAYPDFLSTVDLFAGTSTGALLAVALAKGRTPAELVQLYRENGPRIFGHNLLHEIGSLKGFIAAKYSTQQRREGIQDIIGDGTLDDLLPKHVLVSSFALDSQNAHTPDPDPPRRWKAKFFHNYAGPDSDGAQKALDVVMRSSAAPTFFPVYQGFIDGGVAANNPSLCALAQAIHPATGGQVIQDVTLLSLGTGAKPQFSAATDENWGIAEWNFQLIDLLFDGSSGLAEYQCRQLLGDCYARLNVDLPENIGLDEAGRMEELLHLADQSDLSAVSEWIETQWQRAESTQDVRKP